MSNFNKIFNSTTIAGRANAAKATYASIALLYIYYRLRKRSKSATVTCKDCPQTNSQQTNEHEQMATCDEETWRHALEHGKVSTTKTSDNASTTAVLGENGIRVNTVDVGNDDKKDVKILGNINIQHKQNAKIKACGGGND